MRSGEEKGFGSSFSLFQLFYISVYAFSAHIQKSALGILRLIENVLRDNGADAAERIVAYRRYM